MNSEAFSPDQTTNNNGQSTKEKWEEMKDERKNNDQDPASPAQQEAGSEKNIDITASETDEKWEEMKEERMNNDREPS